MLAYIVLIALACCAAKYFYERQTGKLTDERKKFYRTRIFGDIASNVILLAVVVGIFISLWAIATFL